MGAHYKKKMCAPAIGDKYADGSGVKPKMS